MYRDLCRLMLTAVGLLTASSCWAQAHLNQADPSIVERSLPKRDEPTDRAVAPITREPTSVVERVPAAVPLRASSILVEGSAELPTGKFSKVTLPYLRRDLAGADLAHLVSAISSTARKAGFPFASARIEPQSMADGVLRVKLDAGTLAAVRVIGVINPYADRVLTRALVTGRGVRIEALERAILLVSDIPGVTVKESKYIRQDGFGILLVTIAEDHASFYAQIDNRGSKEVGPVRSTVLGNFRGVLQPGDEVAIISAQTPAHPSEFFFLRGRYTSPLNANGATLSASGSYGRAQPGASLRPLRVIGESGDAALNFTTPLVRRRAQSLWGAVEIRGLLSDQALLGTPLRRDRLATLTAALNGNKKLGPGTLQGDFALVVGLPIPGVTHEGDPRASRSDGDARYLTLGYDIDWTVDVMRHLSIVLASQAQIASRPLLATAEIGVGGPSFGRGYDYAERTGDNGILGSVEVRYDLSRITREIKVRMQVYGTIDGGYVCNLRGGSGGGALLSTAAGIRAGHGLLSGVLEIALPLNADRFDTGNRKPRLSFRLSRVF